MRRGCSTASLCRLDGGVKVSEYFLQVEYWPQKLPNAHRELLQGIIRNISARSDLLGLAIGGSFVSGEMDEYSDLGLKVIADAKEWQAVNEARKQIAASVGPLLATFTAEHIGVPQMLICLYGELPIHVDLHFMVPEQFASRPEDPVILWDRNGMLHAVLSHSKPYSTSVDWQWIEDRFWTWIHYVATRVARGELFETIRFLSLIGEKVLGPIAVEISGGKSHGLRRFEQIAGKYLDPMRSTVVSYNRDEMVQALFNVVDIYRSFRKNHAPGTLRINEKAEEVVIHYLENISRQVAAETA